jgi:hypothetical protein
MTSVMIEIGQLVVSVDTEHEYPDCIDDLTARATLLLNESVRLCANMNWNPFTSEHPNQSEPLA